MEQLEYSNTMNKNEDIDVGKDPYIDDRGEILNYYLDNKINHVGLIDSVKGSVRGNHYHPEQIQSCILIIPVVFLYCFEE